MGQQHGSHSHVPTGTGRHRRRLVVVLAITLLVLVVEVAGGLLSGSLALLADAGHLLLDASGVAVALLATQLAQRPATARRTYGLMRAEILAALGNALALFVFCALVLVEAVRHLAHPVEVSSTLMLAVAVVGTLANTVNVLLLRAGSGDSLNVRGAYYEVLGDLAGSVAVVLASLVILGTGWLAADALASLAIGLLVLPRAWTLLRDVVDVLLEATPRDVDLDLTREHILAVPGVVEVHDVHVWTITSGVPVLSAHVVVDDEVLRQCRSGEVLDQLAGCLSGHFDVAHCTFQLEPLGHREHEHAHHD